MKLKFKQFIDQNKIKQLVKVISSIFIIPTIVESRRMKAHDNTKQYWLLPNSPLLNWLKQHGVEVTPNYIPKYVDGGAGRVYFLNNQKVVKMTANRVEANVAAMVSNRSDIPTPIIDTIYLGDNLYAILQHWVNTNVSNELKQAADYLTVLIDDHPEMDGFPTNKRQQEKLCIETLNKYKGNKELLPYMMIIMDVLSKLYNTTGYKHDDAGPTNIGIHQGKVVIPDLGPNETGSFDTLSALVKINKNRKKLGLPPMKSI